MSVRTASTAVLARRQKTRAHARREILLAAADVFARRGYAAATLAELAQAGGYAAASLYRYFESKEEIFRSLVDLFNAELDATFELPVDRKLPLEQRLGALFLVQFGLAQSHRELFVVIWHEQPVLSAGTAVDPVRVGFARYQERFLAWLRRNVRRRELRCSHEAAARTLTGILHSFHMLDMAAPPKRAASERVHLILDLALHGLHAKPAAARARASNPA